MKNLLLLFIAIFSTALTHAQTQVVPYLITVSKGAYTTFDAPHTKIQVWVNIGSEAFRSLSPESALDVIAIESGKSLSTLAEEAKSAYREESLRLREKGVYRSNPNMEEDAPSIAIQSMGTAKDTTGFVISLYTVATPPPGTKSLRLTGNLSYEIRGKEESELEIEVDKLSSYSSPESAFTTPEGATLYFEKFEGSGQADDPDYYVAFLSGYSVIASGIKGNPISYNEFPLERAASDQPQTVILKVKKLEMRTLDVDEVVDLGMGQ